MDQKKLLSFALVSIVWAIASLASAQQTAPTPKKNASKSAVIYDDAQPESDDFIALLRKNVRTQKKQIIAENLELTEAEAQTFWPVYDQYAAELSKIYDAEIALLKDYAENYQTMNGDEAEAYIRQRADVQQSIMQLRLRYMPLFRKVLSGRKTALFYQLDWRLGLAIDVQLAQVPLINQ